MHQEVVRCAPSQCNIPDYENTMHDCEWVLHLFDLLERDQGAENRGMAIA
jgi:hypothetical protein